MDARLLEELVDGGLSIAGIARRVGEGPWSVRKEVLRLGLRTHRMVTLAENHAARGSGSPTLQRDCPHHGPVAFRRAADGTYVCPRCTSQRVADRRRAIKATLVREAGGACTICGYDRCSAALQFHHVDPSTKSFELAHGGFSRSLAKARAEAAKCVLLCSNCHAEVGIGATTL